MSTHWRADGGGLCLACTGVHAAAVLHVQLQRTLRPPVATAPQRLPPGRGAAELVEIDDTLPALPPGWIGPNRWLLPLAQGEALWLDFDSEAAYPFALSARVDGRDALAGVGGQDYLVVPEQPWMEGQWLGPGRWAPLVAPPVQDAQAGPRAVVVELQARPLRAEHYHAPEAPTPGMTRVMSCCGGVPGNAGGVPEIGQQLSDPWGAAAWTTDGAACSLYLVSHATFTRLTGRRPAQRPPRPADYVRAAMDWNPAYAQERPELPAGAPWTRWLRRLAGG